MAGGTLNGVPTMEIKLEYGFAKEIAFSQQKQIVRMSNSDLAKITASCSV